MYIQHYPYLSELFGGYFHQDAFDEAETDDDVLRDFIQTSQAYQRLGVRADVQRFLHQHHGELVKAMEQAFAPGVVLWENEAELEAWLRKIDGLLAAG